MNSISFLHANKYGTIRAPKCLLRNNALVLFTAVLLLGLASGCATTSHQQAPQSCSNAVDNLPELACFSMNAFKEVREEEARQDLAQQILETAKTQLGLMYRYGGSSPETGFDCSGFTMWVFKQYGIPLPRSSGQQLHAGIPISKEDLKPGDLLIYTRRLGSRSSTHVAIYMGDGKMIHSPHTGRPVSINDAFDSYRTPRFIGARRVILDADEAKVYAQRMEERKKILAQSVQYKVKGGDTLSGLASRYGTSVRAIMAANSLSKAGVLHIGQRLIIPKNGACPPPSKEKTQVADTDWNGTYTVRSGDTIWTIAKRHNVSSNAMLTANNLSKRHTLKIGQKLRIPGQEPKPEIASKENAEKKQVAEKSPAKAAEAPSEQIAPRQNAPKVEKRTAAAPAGSEYEVKSGDNIWSIAKRLKVSEKAMLEANNLSRNHTLRIGQKLVIPGKASVAEVAPRKENTTPVNVSPANSGAGSTYKVRPGDTIWALAKKHGISEKELLAANNLSRNDTLNLGQELVIPSSQ